MSREIFAAPQSGLKVQVSRPTPGNTVALELTMAPDGSTRLVQYQSDGAEGSCTP